MGKRRKPELSEDKEALEAKVESLKEQVETLEKQVYRLRLEKDVLEATAEVLKKPSCSPREHEGFFRISRSSLATRSSRFSRCISACSAAPGATRLRPLSP